MIANAPTGFAVLGDLCIAGSEVEAAYRAAEKRLFGPLTDVIGEATPVVANLECPITDRDQGRPKKYANLRGGLKLAKMLKGLDVAVLGNNHITDFGEEGVRDTLEVLQELHCMPVGYGENLADACQPLLLDVGGRQLGVISFCCPTTNGENLATHLSPGVAPMSMALIRDAVLAAKDRCDALLVYFHWGAEYVHDPVPDQIRVGRYAVECGADVVVGCHSHTVQSYECYMERWIFYGLGNFLFGDLTVQRLLPDGHLKQAVHRQQPENKESLVLDLSIVPDEGQGRIALRQVLAFGFDASLVPKPISREALTFDLDAANARLAQYCARNSHPLSSRHEPQYVCQVRNGILAYFYRDGPLAPLGRYAQLREQVRQIPRLAKSAASSLARFSRRRLYAKAARALQRT